MSLSRLLPLAFLCLAGCAGQLRDYVGPRSSIVRPQLIRYGFSLSEIACVGERLGETLTPRELRLLSRAARAVQRPFNDPDRFTPRDLAWVARAMPEGRVGVEFPRALDACHVSIPVQTAAAPVPTPQPAPAEAAAPPAPRPPTWLNLGAAGSGQAITIDASSLEQEGSTRTAWFRMTDPPPAPPSLHSYRLRIDCARRTIQPLGHRRYDAAGAIAESRDIGPEQEAPLPIEGGTVTEIAYLSLCT
jgi:hypothetical protein